MLCTQRLQWISAYDISVKVLVFPSILSNTPWAEHCLSGCGVVVFSGRIAHGPAVLTAGGLSNCLWRSSLGVLDIQKVALDIQKVAQGGPQGGVELSAVVRCDDRRDVNSAHPPLKQSICTTDRPPPPLCSVLCGIISKRPSVLAAQLLLREKSGA
jgi:hypothetical protein